MYLSIEEKGYLLLRSVREAVIKRSKLRRRVVTALTSDRLTAELTCLEEEIPSCFVSVAYSSVRLVSVPPK